MGNFNFIPQIGEKTNNCYLHGIGRLDNIGHKGAIEFVGRDYFILRDLDNDEVILVEKESYGIIDSYDFS